MFMCVSVCVCSSVCKVSHECVSGVDRTWYAWVMVYPIEVIDFDIDEISDVDPGLLFQFRLRHERGHFTRLLGHVQCFPQLQHEGLCLPLGNTLKPLL